jgi:hypothetical protein
MGVTTVLATVYSTKLGSDWGSRTTNFSPFDSFLLFSDETAHLAVCPRQVDI